MASAATRPPSLGSVKSLRVPPNFPNGLRTALMTATSSRLTEISPAADDAIRLKPADLLIAITQYLGQDFGVVLSEQRRRADKRLRAGGHPGDRADQLDRAEDGIGDIDHQLSSRHVGVVENLLCGLH